MNLDVRNWEGNHVGYQGKSAYRASIRQHTLYFIPV